MAKGIATHLNYLVLRPDGEKILASRITRVEVQNAADFQLPTNIDASFAELLRLDKNEALLWKIRYVQYRVLSYLLNSVYYQINNKLEVVLDNGEKRLSDFDVMEIVKNTDYYRGLLKEKNQGALSVEERMRSVFERATNAQIENLSLSQQKMAANLSNKLDQVLEKLNQRPDRPGKL